MGTAGLAWQQQGMARIVGVREAVHSSLRAWSFSQVR
jgi:hypothetical protein